LSAEGGGGDAVLVVGLSARALAAAARRAGRRPFALDLFGDDDLRAVAAASLVVPGSLAAGFDAAGLRAAACALAPSLPPGAPLVYGAGFEDRPALLAALAEARPLCGNTPETVARTKDPRAFFGLLDTLGIPHPEIRFDPPADPQGWLAKRIGGSGGAHVRPAGDGPRRGAGFYFQRYVSGQAIGFSFLAAGTTHDAAPPPPAHDDDERESRHPRKSGALLLGTAAHWSADGSTYRFGGLARPAPVAAAAQAAVENAIGKLVPALELRGLNSLDAMVDGDRVQVIEVNPRPGANLDLFDGRLGVPLFCLHIDGCAGRLPTALPAAAGANALAVVYADRDRRVPGLLTWPDWTADRSAAGTYIPKGAPVCTVFVDAATMDAARRLTQDRAARILAMLPSDGEPKG
jgi:predicted ATP-grasp superfamily ATP-dependent carboligase